MELPIPNKKYHRKSHRVFSCYYHVVFCPKYRRKVLTGKVNKRTKELITEKQEDYGYILHEMEVMSDHVHLLIDVDPKVGIAKVIGQIKGFLSSQLRKEFPSLKSRLPCLWTRSYFISTVGSVTLSVVKKYIENQKGV